tara:strand:- start:616 stop:840 length:225 start_codon:yes stop_codon:yes gene_type:complete
MSKIKTRDWNAVAAHFRNSAGAMKDRRKGRGGTRNSSRDLLDDYYLEGDVVDTGADTVGNNFFGDNVRDRDLDI